jgi:hypothetical protein
MQGSTLHDDEAVADVVSAGLDGAGEDVLVVNPTTETIRELVAELARRSDPPSVRLLADGDPLKDLVDDFLVGSAIADLVADDRLAVRTLESVPRNFLFVSETTVTAVVDGGSDVAALSTDRPGFVEAAVEHYDGRWEEAEPFSLRTPPRSAVAETLAEEIGQQTREDFVAILDSLASARGNGDGLGEVTISLLVAARNGVLLYDISRWGEDVGLASKATFSRTKTRLEDNGLIDTDKVPIEVGRPRLRLKLGEEALGDVAPAEMAERVRARLDGEA